MTEKSTTEEIRFRFDNDVERFSNLDTGQVSTIDAKISMEILTETGLRIVPEAVNILDIGCGAGNYTLNMLSKIKNLNCTLVDLSRPMLDRARERISAQTTGSVETLQGDVRKVELQESHFDMILAGAVLHHLRDDEDWEQVFHKLFRILKPGGCLLISDLVTQENELLTQLIWEKYGYYLEKIGGKDYRHKVFEYVAKEDSPRSLNYQLNLMRNVGFRGTEILHKNTCFAAFAGIK
jgi:tRNA (cmo5U34)-methyltransferase